MKQIYVRPEITVVEMKNSLMAAVSGEPTVTNGAPDSKTTTTGLTVGTTPPSESKYNVWSSWDE